jgi:predicted RNA-binding Zn ribbon-like protein
MRLPMKRLLILMVVLATLLPTAAPAQYVMDLGNLIAALRVGDFSGDIENLDRAQVVYVTRLTRIAGVRVSGRVIDQTIAARERVLTYLRAIIAQNKVAMKALEVHHEQLEDVIFLTTTNDGSAMLYVDDR